MGRFEDLMIKVREGDQEAIDALESEFSGSALRKQAEAGAAAQAKLDTRTPLAREAALGRLVDDLPEELKGVEMSSEDFEGVDPEDLTIENVSTVARSKHEAQEAALGELAKSQGFESMEAFQEAMEAGRTKTAEKVSTMNKIGGGTTSGGGAPVPDEVTEPFDDMKIAYDGARKEGKSQDKAMGIGIEALLTAQAPVDIDEGE